MQSAEKEGERRGTNRGGGKGKGRLSEGMKEEKDKSRTGIENYEE